MGAHAPIVFFGGFGISGPYRHCYPDNMLVVLKVVSALMLVSLMLGVGLQSDRAHLATVLKNYSLLGRALLANVVIVPFFGVILARTFQLDDYIATGFLLMAIAPGVPFVALAGGRKKGGSLSLAET